jgi:hypothetical protein
LSCLTKRARSRSLMDFKFSLFVFIEETPLHRGPARSSRRDAHADSLMLSRCCCGRALPGPEPRWRRARSRASRGPRPGRPLSCDRGRRGHCVFGRFARIDGIATESAFATRKRLASTLKKASRRDMDRLVRKGRLLIGGLLRGGRSWATACLPVKRCQERPGPNTVNPSASNLALFDLM